MPDSAELMDAHNNDIADMINACLKRDGGNAAAADLQLNSHKLVNLSAGTARNDSVRLAQVQDGAHHYAEASGTANAIALTTSPSCSPVEGIVIGFVAEAENSGATTVELNGGAAVAVQIASAALVGKEIRNGQFYRIGYDGAVWQLLNGSLPSTIADLGTVTTVDINGGTVDGTVIGGSSAAAGTFTAIVGTSLSLGTSGVATVGSIQIGDAADTTLARSSGGNLSIEGNVIYRAGGTDVAVADGGTGASTAAGARTNLGAVLTDAVFPGALVAIIEDQQTSGTAGGTFTNGADRTRVLNTLVFNRNTAVSLSANQFTLPAGSWEIEWSAPAYNLDSHQSMLYDVTGAAILVRGTSEFVDQANEDPMQSRSTGIYRVTIGSSNTYEIRHRCSLTQATNGFGFPAGFGTEVFTRVIVRIG